MRFIFLVFFFSSVSFGQDTFRDSILETMDNLRSGERFYDYEVPFKFRKGTGILAGKHEPYFDTIVMLLEQYEGCSCDIYLSEHNEVKKQLVASRRDKIKEKVHSRTDTSLFETRLYGADYPGDFQSVFGTDKRSFRIFQKIVYVRVNCSESFHFKGESAPFTGVLTEKNRDGTIFRLSPYDNGVLNGYSYVFNSDGSFYAIHLYRSGKRIETVKYQ